MVTYPAATFFMRVEGDGMAGARIEDGDILIIDRSLEAGNGDIVVAVVEGDLIVRRLELTESGAELHRKESEPPTIIAADEELFIWGVVSHSITGHR